MTNTNAARTTTISLRNPEVLQDALVWGVYRLAVDYQGAASNEEIVAVCDLALSHISLRDTKLRAAWQTLRDAV